MLLGEDKSMFYMYVWKILFEIYKCKLMYFILLLILLKFVYFTPILSILLDSIRIHIEHVNMLLLCTLGQIWEKLIFIIDK